MNITVSSNSAEVAGWIRNVMRDQAPFVLSRAINDTAYSVRDEIRRHVEDEFTIRRPWVVRGVQIPPGGKATKEKPEAIIEFERKRSFMFDFEESFGIRQRVARDRMEPRIAPTQEIRGSPKDLPPRALYPKNLRLMARRDVVGTMAARIRTTSRGHTQIQGKRRTFVLDPELHGGHVSWGVFQRIGPRRDDIRRIWTYMDVVRIEPRLRFYRTAEEVVARVFDDRLAHWWDRAIRTAR